MIVSDFSVVIATPSHTPFAQEICDEMASSAAKRGTGIAKRDPAYIAKKMAEGKAIIAFHKDGRWAGFTYIESWEGEKYVANSGLIISPEFREIGLAKVIKRKAFALSIKRFPGSMLFGLTTGLAVMRINNSLGYKPVTYAQLTGDDKFWRGCESCINHHILVEKERLNCLCTAMMFNPSRDKFTFDIDEVLATDVFTN